MPHKYRVQGAGNTVQGPWANREKEGGSGTRRLLPPRSGRHTGLVKEDIAAYWDERYRGQDAVPRGPATWLTRNVALLPPGGRALDVATGTGRHALYLAERGYQVTGVDISPVAVERCRQEAARRGLAVEAVCADLAAWDWPALAFDVVLNFYFLQRDLCPRMETALRPGGVLVFETFTVAQRNFGWGPTEEDFLLRPGELTSLFPTLETLAYREATVEEDERGPKAVAGLVARKPMGATMRDS